MIWFALLLGCPWVGSGYLDELRDRDGDGALGCAFAPESTCDCDDDDASVGAPVWGPGFLDLDGDGLGAGDEVVPEGRSYCPSLGYVSNARDCDDTTSAIGEGTFSVWFLDGDGDGYGGASTTACTAPPDGVARGGDCNDDDPEVNPDAVEQCGPVDEDCDGRDNDDDPNVDADTVCFVDADGDGLGDDASATLRCSCEAFGEIEVGGDCPGGDGDAELHPATQWFTDLDGDGVGGAASGTGCAPPSPTDVRVDGDCDDLLASVYPGAPDIPYDGIDSDCGGGTDLALDDGSDASPDWVLEPAPGDPFPLVASIDQACWGPPIEVTGGGVALQDAIDAAPPSSFLWVRYVAGADNDYAPVELAQSACLVADPGVRITSSGVGDVALRIVAPGPEITQVLVEGIELATDIGVVSSSDHLDLMLSRVSMSDFERLLDIVAESKPPPPERSVRLHRIDLARGEAIGLAQFGAVLRDVHVASLIAPGHILDMGGGSADIVGLRAVDVATGGAFIGAGADLALRDASIDGMLGALVQHTQTAGVSLTIEGLRLTDAAHTDSFIAVSGPSGGGYQGSYGDGAAELRDVRIRGSLLGSTSFAVSLISLRTAVVTDSVFLVGGGAGVLEVFGDGPALSGLAVGGTDVGISTNATKLERVTIRAGTCVLGNPVTPTQIFDHYLAGCDAHPNAVIVGGDYFADTNATFDLLRYHPYAPASTWDLRPNPRSYEKIGDWLPGFVGHQLVVSGASLPYGAYTAGTLVEQLHDADGDGMYDSWEQQFGAYDPAADLDFDGLTNFAEFGDYDLSDLTDPTAHTTLSGSDPTRADTDGDGTRDDVDCAVLDPVDVSECP